MRTYWHQIKDDVELYRALLECIITDDFIIVDTEDESNTQGFNNSN
jgi:hypothetical protein